MTEQTTETITSVPLPLPASGRTANPGTWTIRGELWARVHADGELEVNGVRVALPFDSLGPDQQYAVLVALLAARRPHVLPDVVDRWGDGAWRAVGD